MLEESSTESEQLLVLKSLGNLGSSSTIAAIEGVVANEQLPLRLRVHAIYALRRLAKQFAKQVGGLYFALKKVL